MLKSVSSKKKCNYFLGLSKNSGTCELHETPLGPLLQLAIKQDKNTALTVWHLNLVVPNEQKQGSGVSLSPSVLFGWHLRVGGQKASSYITLRWVNCFNLMSADSSWPPWKGWNLSRSWISNVSKTIMLLRKHDESAPRMEENQSINKKSS